VLRGDDEELDWLRNKVQERVREVRRVKAERIEEKGSARAHCRRGNRPVMPAVMGNSDEEFCWIGGASSERRKRVEGGVLGLFIGGLSWRRG
jgi:hypothetical protein